MAWLALLLIFWKPAMHMAMWAYFKDVQYKDKAINWFWQLWQLVRP